MKATSNRLVQRKMVADQGDKASLKLTRRKTMTDDDDDEDGDVDMDVKQPGLLRNFNTRKQSKSEKNSLGRQRGPRNDMGQVLVRLHNAHKAAKEDVDLQQLQTSILLSSRKPSLGAISMKPPIFPRLAKVQADHKETIPISTIKYKASAKSLTSSAVTEKTCNGIHCDGKEQSSALELMEDTAPNFNVDSGIFFPCDHPIIVNNDTKVLPSSHERKDYRAAVPGVIAVGPTAPDPMEDEQEEGKNENLDYDKIDDGFYAASPNKERFFSSVVSVDDKQSKRMPIQDNASEETDLTILVQHMEGPHLPHEPLPTSVTEVDLIEVDSSENRSISDNVPMAAQVAPNERDLEAPMSKRLHKQIMDEPLKVNVATLDGSLEKSSKSLQFVGGFVVVLVLGIIISAVIIVIVHK